MNQLNLIIGAIAMTLLLFMRLLLAILSKLLVCVVWFPATLMGALVKLDHYLGCAMQAIANLLDLHRHDQD